MVEYEKSDLSNRTKIIVFSPLIGLLSMAIGFLLYGVFGQ
jgi:hypothetical protein